MGKAMNVGTRSVLYGAHCFFLHPWFVAWAWWKLYGFPWDPRLWIAFFVHDLGYLGKPNMDGEEGERHPEFGARIMSIFGKEWHDLALYHSRYYAKKHGAHFSRLCVADKLAIALTPGWLYLPMVHWSGEISEYLDMAESGRPESRWQAKPGRTARTWYADLREYMLAWVEEHRDGREDTWSNPDRHASESGVWR